MVVPPTAAKLRFGNALRQHRERAGLSQTQLAKSSLLSQGMVSAIELGKRSPRREHVARIDQVVTTTGSLLQLWDSLFSPNGLNAYFRDVAELEREATEIREYQLALIPGLFQTETYARNITRIGRPEYTEAEVETQVKARIQRQSVLDADRAPLYALVLDETILRRPIGGRQLMREQLEHLVQVSRWPRVTIQVVPLESDYHPGLDGPFKMLTVPDKGDILYAETGVSGAQAGDQETVAKYARVFGELRGASLPVSASRKLMEEALGAFL